MARKRMERLICQRSELELAGMFDNTNDAGQWLKEHDADLMFLDIEMWGCNGIEFAKQAGTERMIIFTTAYSEYAVDAFVTGAIDYLVKPIDIVRFNQAVDRALAKKLLEENATRKIQGFITVKSERRYVRIVIDDILYAEGLKDYLIIHLVDGRRIITRMTMGAMSDMLPDNNFIRVSKSFIINRWKVESFSGKSVTVNSREIPIGATYREGAMKRLQQRATETGSPLL